jgi:hypothetical protein
MEFPACRPATSSRPDARVLLAGCFSFQNVCLFTQFGSIAVVFFLVLVLVMLGFRAVAVDLQQDQQRVYHRVGTCRQ